MKTKIVITIKGGCPEIVEADQPGAVEVYFRDRDNEQVGEPVRTVGFHVEPMTRQTAKTIK